MDGIDAREEELASETAGMGGCEGVVDSGVGARRTLCLRFWYPRRAKSILWYCTRHKLSGIIAYSLGS
jgi:hypothetical protein